jgi:hypothetical protein
MTYTERAMHLRPVIEQLSQSLDDSTALTAVELFPQRKELVDNSVKVKKGFRFQYDNKLYRTEQPEYTFVRYDVPGATGTESLFSKIDVSHTGTIENPIPFEKNMEIFNGLYYTQYDVLYLCTRDSGQPLYHDLGLLVSAYVEVVERV